MREKLCQGFAIMCIGTHAAMWIKDTGKRDIF